MKKTLLFMLFMSAFSAVNGQSGGPDQFGYYWRDNTHPQGPAYNWIDIKSLPGAVQILGLADDNTVGPFSMPVPFPYYWYTVNQYWVGANGYIMFHQGNIGPAFPTIPDSDEPQDFIAAMGCDLNFAGTGNYGTCWRWSNPAGDSLIVTWDSVPFWISGSIFTGANSFQIILDYTDSSITYQYRDQNGMYSANGLKTGMENLSGTMGLQVLSNTLPIPQTAVKFYYPDVVTLQITDASVQFNDNTTSGARFISKGGAPYTLTAQVINSGNTTLNPFKVNVAVKNSSITLLTTYDSTSVLTPGSTELLTMPNSFSPSSAGQYIMETSTFVSLDTITSNNIKILELQYVDTTGVEIELKYEDGASTGSGISWTDGNGGLANYFIPPFYPCRITKVKAYINSDPDDVGYSMLVHDDDGANGFPGTRLDSVNVAGGTYSTGMFTTTLLTAPITITSGGFYVTWLMGGADIELGTNEISGTSPVSRRAFELLANHYSEYRYRETEDLMIRAVLAGPTVGVKEINHASLILYPNPANEKVYIELNDHQLSPAATLQMYDINGRLVKQERLSLQGSRAIINTAGLSDGLYNILLSDGNNLYSSKLNIVH